MQTENLVLFRAFNDLDSLNEFSELLEHHQIPFKVDDSKQRFDVTFSNNDTTRFYQIKIRVQDQERVQAIADQLDLELIKSMPTDYYLFDFTEEELKDVIKKNFEWSNFDVKLATKLLADKGIVVTQEEIQLKKQEHLDLLDEPEKENKLVIICGYILCFLGGILGVVIAIALLNAKKTNSAGIRVPTYSANTRKHAKNMLVIFVFILCSSILFSYLTL